MDGLDYVILSPCDDKDKRRRTHEAVRKYFGGFESDVAEDANGAKWRDVRSHVVRTVHTIRHRGA